MHAYRNPECTRKRAITDCQLLIFILLMVALEITIFLVYVGVETAAPGYELDIVTNQDQPRGLVGVWKILREQTV